MNFQEANAFIKRRDEMLEKRSLEALDDFIATDPVYEKDPARENWKFTPSIVREMTLCKMILIATEVSIDTKEWAKKRLEEIRKESIENYRKMKGVAVA